MKLKIKNDTTLKVTHNGSSLRVLCLLLISWTLYLTYIGFTQSGQAALNNARFTVFLTLGVFLLTFYIKQWLRPTTRGVLTINKATGNTLYYSANPFGAQHQGAAGTHLPNHDIVGIELSITRDDRQVLIEHLNLIVQTEDDQPGDTIPYPIASIYQSTHHVGFTLDEQATQIATFLGITVTRKSMVDRSQSNDVKAAEMTVEKLTNPQDVPRLKPSTVQMSKIALITAIVLPPIGFILAQLSLRRIGSESHATILQRETLSEKDQTTLFKPFENDALKAISRLQVAGILAVCCTLLLVVFIGPKFLGKTPSPEHTDAWDTVNSIEHEVSNYGMSKEHLAAQRCSGLLLTPNLDDQEKAKWSVSNQYDANIIMENFPDSSEIAKDDLVKLFKAYTHIYEDEAEAETPSESMGWVHTIIGFKDKVCVTMANPYRD